MTKYACRLALSIAALATLASLTACEASNTSASSSSGTPNPAPGTGDGGPAPVADAPDLDAMARGGDCAEPAGPGVDHTGDITADETWRAADGPHRIASNVRVLATVTVEACAKVVASEGGAITVGTVDRVGKLVAAGTRTPDKLSPVRFVAADAAKSWGAIIVDAKGTTDLSYTVIADADAPGMQQNGGGALRVYGASSTSTGGTPAITPSTKIEWLLIDNSRGAGANMLRYAGFAEGSHGLAVRGSKSDPVRIEIGAVSAIPTGIVLSGNAHDEIGVTETWSGTLSHTFLDRGYPYRILHAIYLQPVLDGAPAVMTVEPGVTLRFTTDAGVGGVYVGTTEQRQGQIVAKGTAAKPIRFTSAKDAPAPGDWLGVYFRYYPTSGQVFEHVTFEYAGATSGANGFGCGPKDNDATMLILGARPAESWVRNSTFRNGAGGAGIVSGWVSDEPGPDFKATNTFESMPACSVSRWKTVANGCGTNPDPQCL